MAEFLSSIDLSIFYFVNHTLRNPVFDWAMPILTDLNKNPVVLAAVLGTWLWLVVKGGITGRYAALLLVLTIVFSDQLNSSFIKHLVDRVRPCHALTDVHLLVPCGSGYSFPSSHAVNNFAGAIVLSYFFRKWTWAFFSFASVVAFSRVYVGVHYPSDVVGGAILGSLCGLFMLMLAFRIERWWKLRNRSSTAYPPEHFEKRG